MNEQGEISVPELRMPHENRMRPLPSGAKGPSRLPYQRGGASDYLRLFQAVRKNGQVPQTYQDNTKKNNLMKTPLQPLPNIETGNRHDPQWLADLEFQQSALVMAMVWGAFALVLGVVAGVMCFHASHTHLIPGVLAVFCLFKALREAWRWTFPSKMHVAGGSNE